MQTPLAARFFRHTSRSEKATAGSAPSSFIADSARSHATRQERTPGVRLSKFSAVTVAACTLAVALSGCSALPSVEHTASTVSADPCTTALLAAQESQDASSGTNGSAIGMVGRFFAARDASRQWLVVATQCSPRFSEGVVKAAAAYHSATLLARKTGLDSLLPDFSVTTLDSSVNTDTLRAIAVAQDKAAYSLEVLAARQRPTNAAEEKLSLTHRDIAASVTQAALACSGSAAADTGSGSVGGTDNASCSTTDPRKKVYAVENLLDDSTDSATSTGFVDAATGLSTTLRAAVEMDCALEELQAVGETGVTATGDDGTDSSTNAGSNTGADTTTGSGEGTTSDDDGTSSLRAQLAAFIARDVASALSQEYPTTPLPLVDSAASVTSSATE